MTKIKHFLTELRKIIKPTQTEKLNLLIDTIKGLKSDSLLAITWQMAVVDAHDLVSKHIVIQTIFEQSEVNRQSVVLELGWWRVTQLRNYYYNYIQ